MAVQEEEFRKRCVVESWTEALRFLPSRRHKREYVVKYNKSFRIKNDTIELKVKAHTVARYVDHKWFEFVVSEELPYARWSRKTHRLFYHELAFNTTRFEYRVECELTHDAKVYAYDKGGAEYGVVFECETNSVDRLTKFSRFYSDFPTNLPPPGGVPADNVFTCTRKRVKPVTSPPSAPHVKALKHDGVYGFVSFHKNGTVIEKWEDNILNSFDQRGSNLAGLTFAAERLESGEIVLLDVLRVNGLQVQGVREILLDFLPSIENSLPPNYSVQKYYLPHEEIPLLPVSSKVDGIIFHCFTDDVFKMKNVHTIDLLYTNNEFQALPQPYNEIAGIESRFRLENGRVYECEICSNPGIIRVCKERRDRVLGNSDEQIIDAFQCSGLADISSK